jgi:uncharacterized damage-inducible protein DinB
MELHEMVAASYESILRALGRTLDGLTEEDLNWQPTPDCNSIGWLAWHLTRAEDSIISGIMGEEQLWIKDGWHQKFGRPADARDSGSGHTAKDLAAFKSPDVKTLLAYHQAVLERTKSSLPKLSKTDLDKVMEGLPFKPPPTVGMMLILGLEDGLQHAGQAAYIRGMRQGLGWQKH